MAGGEKSFDVALDRLETYRGRVDFYNMRKVSERGYDLSRLPYSVRILLENAIRNAKSVEGSAEAANRLLEWPRSIGSEFPFMPYRVLLQDYTGVPLIVDLAAMRDAMSRLGKDPARINSIAPVDLVIDHSVQVDRWGSTLAFEYNIEREYERNSERYALLKWAQDSFKNMRVFPPGKGICHQVNLEHLATVVAVGERAGRRFACPDTVVGTDSHTPMVNGLGVLGWGVGGMEAEAAMLGQPCHIPIPRVVGVRLKGELKEGATTTDLVLYVTELLRKKDVVDAFVEYFGDGYWRLSVPDRATLGNMSPEYGATVGFSPVDAATLRYLHDTGREEAHIKMVEEYCRLQGLFFTPDSPEPRYSEVLEVDMGRIEPSVAGPRNPEERHALKEVPSLARSLAEAQARSRSGASQGKGPAPAQGEGLVLEQRAPPNAPGGGQSAEGITDGSVVIAAITSCTNTSNPSVMIGAALLARNAVNKGLSPKPFVKCSLAPGSTVVEDYLEGSGLLKYLDMLGFYLVGYGCTTCIGNSGPLAPAVERAIRERDLYAVAALSGNRNFDGRINALARGAFLMSPMLVVAYALAGNIGFDFQRPLGTGNDGKPVYLKDLWPTLKEIQQVAERSLSRDLYRKRYADALVGDEKWDALLSRPSATFPWDPSSTYVRNPPWFATEGRSTAARVDVVDARVLALFEDKITTDHISPAGVILADSPAAKYLSEHGVDIAQYSTYGSRRGNHEVMVRGGFSNPRLKNLLADGKIGGYTKHFPSGEVMTIFDASARYLAEGVPLIVIAGRQYGGGSSRDWAAKAPKLLGVKAVIAESFERIHRSNLVAMGVLPLEFAPGQGAKALGLAGDETYSIGGTKGLKPGSALEVTARSKGAEVKFKVRARIDSEAEMAYFDAGGVLPYVLSKLAG
ncbi:MAG TPA: aconitate hydratase AcnA [Nitrososphaerales archaeon]|nr:aconitate hydratase AcnA [Nitrososphaerales archaeon]HUK75334.1 aconitate hydratase AcnA [Nitrososphaerales archaeon]